MTSRAGVGQVVMTGQVGQPTPDDAHDWDAFDEDNEYADPNDLTCHTCGGDGYEFCEDVNSSEGCWERDCNGHEHTCPNCKGSGRAKDCWYW